MKRYIGHRSFKHRNIRHRVHRHLNFKPDVYYFKPRGVPMHELEEIIILKDELEALKLHDVDNLDQIKAAEKMGISQPTFARTLDRVYKKIADALINGKAINFDKENIV